MTYMRMPLTVWGLWLTAILNVLFVPVLGSAALLLLLDRVFGTQFFVAGASAVRGGGDPILFQHLFWIFGHPEVYILILPAWGIVGDLVSFFARKPAYWYRGSVCAMIAVTVLSAVVYGHHMFVTGMNPLLGQGFMLLTLIISVPARCCSSTGCTPSGRARSGSRRRCCSRSATVFVFGLGGLTGLFLGTISTDLYLHDTMFVVGHFHFTMAAASFLGELRGALLLVPEDVRAADERAPRQGALLGARSCSSRWCSAASSSPATRASSAASTIRTSTRSSSTSTPLNQWTSYFAFALGVGQLLFVVQLLHERVRAARRRRRTRGRSARSSGRSRRRRRSPQLRRRSRRCVRGRTSSRTPRRRSVARARLADADRGAARGERPAPKPADGGAGEPPPEPERDGVVAAPAAATRARSSPPRSGWSSSWRSWAMMFCALFFAYGFVRAARDRRGRRLGLPPLPRLAPALNTVVMLALERCVRARHPASSSAGAARALLWLVGATFVLGAMFLGLQVAVWRIVGAPG